MFYLKLNRDKVTKTKLKFLITSRPYFNIERRFRQLTKKMPTIRLRGEEETESIRRKINFVIEHNVSELKSKLELDDSLSSLIKTELLKITHRTYLWLHLTFKVIRSSIGFTKSKFREIISTLPNTVKNAYQAILDKSKDKIRTKKLLHIVVSTTRPLTLQEMSIALAVQSNHKSYDDLDLENEGKQKETIRNLCGLFINVINKKVYLIHQTAKEFLVCKDAKLDPSCLGTWKQSLVPRESNLVIVKSCIWYLLFTVFERNPPLIDPRSVRKNGFRNMHSFFDYAAVYWVHHFRKAEPVQDVAFLESTLTLCNNRSKRCRTWRMIYGMATGTWLQRYQSVMAIKLVSYLGLIQQVELLIEKGADVNAQGGHYGNALQAASSRGHESIAQLLIEKGADVGVPIKDGSQHPPR